MAEFMEFDLFSMFGEEPVKEEVKKEEKKAEEAKDTVFGEGTILPEKGGFGPVSSLPTDDVDEDDSSDEASEDDGDVKESSKTTTKAPVKAGKSSITGKTKVKLPLSIYANSFAITINELADPTWNGVVKELYNRGYKGVACSDVTFIVASDNVAFLKMPNSPTAEDELVFFPENGEVVVCDGMLQTPVSLATLGKDADEVSVEDLYTAFANINAEYSDCNIKYSAKAGVAVPVYKEAKSIKLPATVTICGTRQEVTTDDFPATNEPSAEDVFYNYIPMSKVKGVEMFYGQYSDGTYTILFKKVSKGGSEVQMLDKTFSETIKDAKSTKVEEKYKLPFELVATSSDQRLTATSEMFGGKAKVTQKEVLELLATPHADLDPQLMGFKIYGATDRQFNFVWGATDTNRKLVVSATSGKKG